jgi:peptide-methionine (R)-S-oxide reductase
MLTLVSSNLVSAMSRYVKDPDAIARLSPEQFRVTQENATEQPFGYAYWNHDEPGLYVDVISGEPLFSSLDKFDSDCGWPSFTKPIESDNIEQQPDNSHGTTRTEVRSSLGGSQLGHVFDDGPQETGEAIASSMAGLPSFAPGILIKRFGRLAFSCSIFAAVTDFLVS